MKRHTNINVDVSVVAFEGQAGGWVAQCLEYDISAFAETLPQLPDAFCNALIANFCINAHLGRKAFDGIPVAPSKFRDMFESSRTRLSQLGDTIVSQDTPHIKEMRVAALG